MATVAGQGTIQSAAAWRPDQFAYEPHSVLEDAAILTHTTGFGEIHGDQPVKRIAYAVDDNAEFVDEGAEIDQSEPEMNEAVIYTRKIAQLLRITNEQYNQGVTAELLARSVARAMTAKCDHALLAQAAPTAPATAPVAGLLNTTGIESKTAVATNLDKLIELEAAVRTNGAQPTAWILAPDTWALLRKQKTATDSNLGILGAGTTDSLPWLLSIPVVINAQMPSKSGLLVDRACIMSVHSQLKIAISEQQYFTSDSVAVRATWRTGHVVPRPNRIGKFTMT